MVRKQLTLFCIFFACTSSKLNRSQRNLISPLSYNQLQQSTQLAIPTTGQARSVKCDDLTDLADLFYFNFFKTPCKNEAYDARKDDKRHHKKCRQPLTAAEAVVKRLRIVHLKQNIANLSFYFLSPNQQRQCHIP